MKVTTTGRGPKPFAWSYSKLKNFESCPKRHFHYDIQKDVKEDESDQLVWGNLVHKSAHELLSKGKPLPAGMTALGGWCARIQSVQNSKILVEQKFAITKDFGPCEWFASDAWFRGIGDVVQLIGNVALIIDWKTGKILEDSHQLALNAACVFAHFPEVQKVRSEFVWLKEGPGVSSRADFARSDMPDMWRQMWPRIESLKIAHDTGSYPAKPGRLCRNWCGVKACPHWGE